MSAFLRQMRSLSARTTIFATAAIIALAVNVAVAFYAIGNVGIGGSAYTRVIQGKDLVADILPPPEYLIEAYLEANLLNSGRGDIKRLAQLHKDFEERKAYWRGSNLPQDLKVQLGDAAGAEGDKFWAELEGKLLPAVVAQDKIGAEGSFARLSELYGRHRAAIDRLVTMADAFAKAEETSAKAQMPLFSWIMIGVAAIGLTILVAAIVAVRRGVVRPIVGIGREIADLETMSSNDERAVRSQLNLEGMVDTVRLALEQRGAARRSGDQLFFGQTLIHGELDFIADLQRRFGCVVTIFAGDLRVATNLRQADGRSAIGTRLADEAIRGPVLGGHTAHRESEIFGVRHITIYQPILDAADVIGIIAVAIPIETETRIRAADESANEIARIGIAVARLREAFERHRSAEQDSTLRRYHGTDAIRRATAVQAANANGQRIVVAALSDALEHLASTDLTHSIEQDFPDEYRKLKANFGSATDILRETVRLITGQAETIAGVTDEIAQAAQELALRTERQAANVEETSAALNEITVAVRQTAERANRTHELMGQARRDAEHSEVVVRDAKIAMSSIQDSSNKIAEIIGVIDGIAFQTNLLALNAGVEAARAGDTGRGFAVVASEVRALAQRATEAARDIKSLISDSTEKVDQGVRLVGETGDALLRIIERVSEVNGVVAEIAKSAHDQSVSLHEINTAVKQVDQTTQQNAAMVEETTAASTSLAEEMRALAALLQRFKIEDGEIVRRQSAA